MKRLYRNLRSLLRSEQGSAMPLVGLGVLVLVGSTGVAVDMARVQVAQSRMANALDAAGLAAGANANSVDLNAEVNKYFNANYPPGYMGTRVDSVTVSGNADLSVLTLNSAGTVPMTLTKVFGINEVPISAESQVTRSSSGLELALVLDTTGSMLDPAGGGISKLQAAKNASNTLLSILYGSATTIPNLWVGLVPFAQGVNIGTSHAVWTPSTVQNWGPSPWMGCVEAREAGGRDVTDEPPTPAVSTSLFPKYYWACHTMNNAWFGTNSSRDNCQTSPAASVRYKSGLGTNIGPNRYCSQAIQPMTANKPTVTAAINSLQANGNTHIVLGASWAWRMLSPRWKTLWGGEMNSNDLPLNYNTPLMNKVMVLMTDGDNTISTSVRGAYGYLSEGRLGTTNSSAAVTQLNNRLLQVCSSMKANNIIIYTVAFGTGISGTSQTMLRNCATRPEYYFYSPTGTDLQNAFRQIGDSLANLRISK